jgi:hypothetical protein
MRGVDLTGAFLYRSSFYMADLSEAKLRDANLNATILKAANLRYADLQGADLRSADLREADLSGANLSGAKLTDSKMSGAVLYGADLRSADFNPADLRDAILEGSLLPEGFCLPGPEPSTTAWEKQNPAAHTKLITALTGSNKRTAHATRQALRYLCDFLTGKSFSQIAREELREHGIVQTASDASKPAKALAALEARICTQLTQSVIGRHSEPTEAARSLGEWARQHPDMLRD